MPLPPTAGATVLATSARPEMEAATTMDWAALAEASLPKADRPRGDLPEADIADDMFG